MLIRKCDYCDNDMTDDAKNQVIHHQDTPKDLCDECFKKVEGALNG